MNNIDYYNTYDLPVPYKNINIYPITVKDYMLFSLYSQCFLLDKNSIPDAKIISMSELEYLYYATMQNIETTPYLLWFDRILALSIKDDDSFNSIEASIHRYKEDERGKPIFYIQKTSFTSKDYIEIKKIICEQNMVELPDENISKEVRDSLKKAQEYKNKISGTNPGSFEDYLISLSVTTGWSLEKIYSMTIRKFIKSIRRLDNYIHYKIYLTASMSGMVTFKDTSFIKHWLTNLDDKDEFNNVSIELEAMQNKVSLENANKI